MEHLSDQTLERLERGQLDGEALLALQRHLSACAECRARAPVPPLEFGLSDTRAAIVNPAGQSAQPRLPPETLLDGKWLLGRRLGVGGMGEVYLAMDVVLERPVAIKLMSPALATLEEGVLRFEREARILARLEHPNLVPIYAVGRRAGVPFIVMKYLEGVTLSRHLASVGRLPLEEARDLLRQLCAGLGFVHTKGVIHRDIKPANIFLGPEGRVTILDLGIAHDQEIAQDKKNQLTESGALVGTPRYMSPEQIEEGAGRIDHRSDLYALGIVAYEMLTGQALFEAKGNFELMRAHTEEPPPDVRKTRPELPLRVSEVLQRALAKKPQDRYATCAAFLEDFEAACLELPFDASHEVPLARVSTPPIPSDPLRGDSREEGLGPTVLRTPPVQRRRVWKRAGLAVALGVLALGIVAGALLLAQGPGEQVVHEPAQQPLSTGDIAPPAARAAEGGDFAPLDLSGETEVALAPRRQREPSSRRTTSSASRKEAPQPLPQEPAPATVRIATTSSGKGTWAWLDVDGIRHSNATPTTLTLPAGNHRIRVLREGHGEALREVVVKPGDQLLLQLELAQ